MRVLKYMLVVLSAVASTKCASILGVFSIQSISHQIVYQPIWKELSLRGHQVTVITPNPLNDPTLTNLTEIDISRRHKGTRSIIKEFSLGQDHWEFTKTLMDRTPQVAENLFNHSKIRTLINDPAQKFDVVLAENIIPFTSVFATKFKCPLIGVSSLGVSDPIHEAMGNPVHPVLYPDYSTTYSERLNFLKRIDTVLFSIWLRYYYRFVTVPAVDIIVKRYFGQNTPYLGHTENNLSMLFLNTNPILHKSRPYGPGVIEMGRMHLKPRKALPEDLEQFLNEAKKGVIYFSLGSNIKSAIIDKEKRKLITEVFAELPYKILWKFENEQMEGKPDNVLIKKWLPQQDILAYPNIKLFITQAGLQSTEEAIVNKVPVLGIPFIADQHYNSKRYVTLGIGLNLNFRTLARKEFKETITELIKNPRYKENVGKIADILKDESNAGLERALFWTEYVIRHKGAPYFRSPALDVPFYQYYLLDVLSLFIGVIFLVTYSTQILIKRLKSIIVNKCPKHEKSSVIKLVPFFEPLFKLIN